MSDFYEETEASEGPWTVTHQSMDSSEQPQVSQHEVSDGVVINYNYDSEVGSVDFEY